MLSPFITGAGGVTSSEILPNRIQFYKIESLENNGDNKKKSNIHSWS
jgi:hypothetical protein